MFRLGLGIFMGNPLSGYIMVIKTIGRKTGQVRYTPVNYAIMNGNVYCLAGFGKKADWYRNIKMQPNIEAILPGGAITGCAEEIVEPDERLKAARQTLKNGGFASFAAGINPYSLSDDTLRDKLKSYPVIRIRPTGLGSGAGDAGGWLWILMLLLTLAIILWLVLR